MRMRTIAVIIVLFPLSAFAATPLEPVVLGPSPSVAYLPATAFAGGKYLTVWDHMDPTGQGIWGAFSDGDGNPLGPEFPLINGTDGSDLRLFADDDSFVLYWTERNLSGAVARIDSSGRVTKQGRVLVPIVTVIEAFVDGRGLAMTANTAGTEAMIVDAAGQVVRRGIAATDSAAGLRAFRGNHSFFLTRRAPSLTLSRYSRDGDLLKTFTVVADQCHSETSPCLAIRSLHESAAGHIVLAVSEISAFSRTPRLATMTVSADGAVSERRSIPTSFSEVTRVEIGQVGSSIWLVTVGRNTAFGAMEVEASLLDENGAPAGQPVRLVTGLDQYHSVTFADDSASLFFVGIGEGQVLASLFRELKPAAPRIVSIAPSLQDATQLASNGRDYLGVWRDARDNSDPQQHWAVLDSGGGVRSQIFTAAGEPVRNSLVSNGLDYLILTGSGAHSVRAIRIGSDGTLLGEIPITDNLSMYSWVDTGAAAVPTSAGYLVVWTEGDILYGSVISPSGVATSPHEVLRITDQEIGWRKTYEDAALGWNGREVLLAVRRSKHVFTGFPTGDFSWDELQAFRLTADGRLKSPDPVVFDSGGYRPLVASSGDAFLIASWDDRFVVRDDGSVTSFTPLNEAVSTDLLWDGSTYILAGRFTVERLARDGASLGTAVNDRLDGTVDVAVDTEGHLVIVASESNGSGPLRAHSYIPSDLTPIPPKRRRAAGH